MLLYHNSQDINFRSPFGAAETGATIRLGLRAECETEISSAYVRLWFDERKPLLPMEISQTGKSEFFCTSKFSLPEKPCLVWYYFQIHGENKTYCYSNSPGQLGGVGVFSGHPPTNSYQITVYDKSFKTPDWFKNTTIYQISPDRFFREGNFSDIQKNTLNTPYTKTGTSRSPSVNIRTKTALPVTTFTEVHLKELLQNLTI